MAAYTGIQGQNILIVSSDPANPTEGQIWYNTTSQTLKGYANVVTNAFASGGNLNTARNNVASANSGTQTAALAFGGAAPPGNTGATESYNGTSWTNSPNSLNTARTQLGGTGIQTAALAFGGSPVTGATELWNGTSWTTSPATLNTTRRDLSGAGLQTATIAFGGVTGAPAYSANSESWNGTSWTATPALNTARQAIGSAGTQTAALAIGGNSAGDTTTAAMEAWNGSSWTTSTSIPAARQDGQSFGLQTAAVFAGGQNNIGSNFTNTFLWNGTSWTTNPNSLATARGTGGGAGTQSSGIIFGGIGDPGPSAATEEWTGTALATRTITTS